jgi:uncharacterized protein
VKKILELRECLDQIPIVDTHEHFLPPTFLRDGENTLLRILKNSYLGADCISAGMDPQWWKQGSIVYGDIDLNHHPIVGEIDLDALFFFLERVQNTAYSRALMLGFKEIYDFNGKLNSNTWKELSNQVQLSYDKPDWFDTVLTRMGIHWVLLDPYFVIDNPVSWSNHLYFDFHVDDFLDYPWAHPVEGKSAVQLTEAWGLECNTFNDLLNAIEKGFSLYQERKGIATKIGVAYRRSLLFDQVTTKQAARAFDILKSRKDTKAVIDLGNFIVRYVIRKSIEVGFVVQVHTGYQGGFLNNGNPTHLVNLLTEFPQAKFVLFHGGYPYSDEAGLLAKAFPNVYLDLCWMPLLSPSMTIEILLRWIDLIPQNKLMWGGDVWSVEECFGAVMLFKDALAKVLGRLVDEQNLGEKAAIQLAERIMHQNAREIFEKAAIINL